MKEIFRIPDEYVHRGYDKNNKLPKYRSQFMRDRDRVIYCTAFRRLAGKTQIYTIGSDDHKKNRLTHSLEVAQISRTIATALGLNPDLAEAIALAHDLGHTPFGHAGERLLNEIMVPGSKLIKDSPFNGKRNKDILDDIEREAIKIEKALDINSMYGFKHNLQSVRVVSVLEDSYRDGKGDNIGLNLTNYTLWGIMNHSSLSYNPADIYPNYQNQFLELMSQKNSDQEAWSFEGYIVKIADEIAQWHHDLEDAMRGGAVPIAKICDTILASLGSKLTQAEKRVVEENKQVNSIDRRCVADLSHVVVNTLVNDVIKTSDRNMGLITKELKKGKYNSYNNIEKAKLIYGSYASLGLQIKREEIVGLSDQIDGEKFKEIIVSAVHHSSAVERMNSKGAYIIKKLFEAYNTHPQQLPDGPILHFMVGVGAFNTIDDIRSRGSGEMRTAFDGIIKNPPIIYRILLMRRICDHIASMTDRYAIEEYNNLYG